MRFHNFVTLSAVTGVFGHVVPLSPRDINAIGSTQDIPAVQNAITTLTTAIKEGVSSISVITEDTISTSVNKWVGAGKIINQGLVTAAEQIQGSTPIGLFEIGNIFRPLQTLGQDLTKALSSAPSIPLAQKSPKGKEGLIRLIREIEPGLKVFTVSLLTQLPPQASGLLNTFRIKLPKTAADLDKPFDVLNRAMDSWYLGEFDRYINSLKETQLAGNELVTSGTLDKVLGQAKGTLQTQLAEAAARAAKGVRGRGRRGGKGQQAESQPAEAAAVLT